jgi:crotonobetainyl-CoA:carnitine CoA-transferase CaiB-like acyl-CoA transferase
VHLDVALQEAVTHLSIARWAAALRDGTDVDVSRIAAFSPGMGMFRTSDGRWVALASVEDKFWRGTCEVLGLPELSVAGAAVQDHGAGESAALRALDVTAQREAELRASGALAPAPVEVPA